MISRHAGFKRITIHQVKNIIEIGFSYEIYYTISDASPTMSFQSNIFSHVSELERRIQSLKKECRKGHRLKFYLKK